MAALERAAKAWISLGRVLYPSLAEVEASLAAAQPDHHRSTVSYPEENPMARKFDADMEQVLHEALDAEVYSGNRGLNIDPDETSLLDLTAFCLEALLEKYELTPRKED